MPKASAVMRWLSGLPLQWRLAAFYGVYYSTVGAYMAYWTPYLAARGLSAPEIGIAYAFTGLSRAVVPLAWGWWADRSGHRVALIRFASLASLLLFLMIPAVSTPGAIIALMLAYTLFWNALLPQFEVVAIRQLQRLNGDYARTRVWGSIGFMLTVLAVGPLLDWLGVRWEPWVVGLIFALMSLLSWSVPDLREGHGASTSGRKPSSLLRTLARPRVRIFLFVTFCVQLSFAPYYTFFTLFLTRHGYAASAAGQLWAIAVLAEIGIFLVMRKLIARMGVRRLMLLSLFSSALRWVLTATMVDHIGILVLTQTLHALSFAALHSACMHYVQALFPATLQGRGQALYSGISYGIGGSIGSLGAGYLWVWLGPEAIFMLAAVAALVGLWFAWRGLPRDLARERMHAA